MVSLNLSNSDLGLEFIYGGVWCIAAGKSIAEKSVIYIIAVICIGNLAFVLRRRSQWASVWRRFHCSARSTCSELLQDSGGIGGRIGFTTLVESNE